MSFAPCVLTDGAGLVGFVVDEDMSKDSNHFTHYHPQVDLLTVIPFELVSLEVVANFIFDGKNQISAFFIH